ncbi:tubulin polyglutamylase TTLL4 isoform X1 [Esox lucius]|uniref:Tubulin tyrosine ligase-like family, member 4 n=1 Tax=Esox lucius TaxID=8010 RepID=A0A3P8Y382_ESOLU|nr:tubulin polyglutamylase TTLL4 isoform X1 [Esox lucius]
MAFNGAEDKWASNPSSALTIRAKSAVCHSVNSLNVTAPSSHKKKLPLRSSASVPPVSSDCLSRLSVRQSHTQKNQFHGVSGTPLQSAYLFLPRATVIANKPQRPSNAGDNAANRLSNGHCQPSTPATKKTTVQLSRSDIIAYTHKPGVLKPIIHSSQPGWNLDSLKLRSRILARKRALSPHPAVCPSSPKAECVPESQPGSVAPRPPEGTAAAMPTNQSVPWATGKLRDNRKSVMRPDPGNVPSQSSLESAQTRGSAGPLYPLIQAASYCYVGDNGDGKARTEFTDTPHLTSAVPSWDGSSSHRDVTLDQIWKLQGQRQSESLIVVEADQPQKPGCCAAGVPHKTRTERTPRVCSEVGFTQAVRKLTGTRRAVSAAPQWPRLGTINSQISVTGGSGVDLVKLGKALATSSYPVCQNHSPAVRSAALSLTEMEQTFEPAVVTTETTCSSGTGSNATPNATVACRAVPSQVLVTPTRFPNHISASQNSTANATSDNTEGSPRPSVTTVTTQISAIDLTQERRVQCLEMNHSPSCASPSLDEEEVDLVVESFELPSRPESVAIQEDVDRENSPDDDNDCSVGDDDDDDDDDGSDESDGSDCSSVNDALSTASMAALSNVADEELMSPEPEEGRELKPALIPSLFPLRPPTLYFSTADQRVEPLPPDQRKLLKWKMSSVTPNVVKHTIARSHFKATKKSHDWLGCWGHHMKSPGFKAIREYQKLNHFPGSFQIGRKDRLWRNLSKMQAQFGKREFGFFPRSFVLPQDIKLLRKVWEDSGSRQKWIIKPPASARGIGIQVIHKWSQMPRKRPLLVQKYLHKPYLIAGSKFDLRVYVYVSSYDPLRVYVFQDGLVRFASCKYSSSMKSLGNKFMHLTNYSVNKKNSEYQNNDSDKACQGHKWALKALWHYLGSKGVNTTLIWEKIKDIVIKTIIASDPYVNTLVKMHLRSPYSCHELFGFDIMLDENLKPWVLEVNISPSLHSNTALDVAIKGQMIRDVLNLAGFVLPQREDMLPSSSSASSSTSSLCGGTREKSRLDISTDEKVKRAFYLSQRFADQELFSSILDVLTPEDVRVLADTEDELSRRGQFERVFPSNSSSRYLRFFEHPRYLNILLSQWETKYGQNKTKGINILRTLCQRGVHLGTNDPAHKWSKPHYLPTTSQEPSRPSVVVSLRRRSQPDQDEDCFDREVQSVTSSLPDISLLGSSTSPSPTPSPSLASPAPRDYV